MRNCPPFSHLCHSINDSWLTQARYHVPSHVSPHVDYITPGLRLRAGKKSAAKKDAEAKELEKRGFRTTSNQNFSAPLYKGPAPVSHATPNATMLAMCDTMITPVCIASEFDALPLGVAEGGRYADWS